MSAIRCPGGQAAMASLAAAGVAGAAEAAQTAAAGSGVVAVVDGLSSGALLAPALRARGYRVFHVQSSTAWSTPNTVSFQREQYEENLIHGGDPYHMHPGSASVALLAGQLAKAEPEAVFAGAESGVVLADHLSEALGLRSNGTKLSHARRNKGKMAQRLAEAGVRVARHIRAKSADEIIRWVRDNRIQMPVFLKPETAGGTMGMKACSKEEQIPEAYEEIHGGPNSYGIRDGAVFAQEYMGGPEYALNTVSANGRHLVTGIWEYGRHFVEGAATVYDWDRMMPFQGPVQDRLVEYGFQVLNALGVRHGPSHLEIKMEPDGPTLVEMGARMVGSQLPRLESMATDRNTVDLAIDAFLHPGTLRAYTPDYELLKHAMIVSLKNEGQGGRMTHEALPQVRALGGHVHDWFRPEGTPVAKTVDASLVVGEVWLAHEDPQVVSRSMERLRAWERGGRFVKG